MFAHGFHFISADDLLISDGGRRAWADFQQEYEDLPVDEYLPGQKRYRYRRYGVMEYAPSTNALSVIGERPFFQDKEINRATGGIHRKFAPLKDSTYQNEFLQELIKFDFAQLPLSAEYRNADWAVGIHLIRVISTEAQPGLPAPEGVHQDGHDYVAQHLVKRQNVVGGFTVFFDLQENPLDGLILEETLDTVYVDDSKVKHFATPVRPRKEHEEGVRDMLLIDFRKRPRDNYSEEY